jgi:hypothetical protein
MYRFNKICVLSWRQIRLRQKYFLWAKAVFGFESGSEIIAKAGSGSEKKNSVDPQRL